MGRRICRGASCSGPDPTVSVSAALPGMRPCIRVRELVAGHASILSFFIAPAMLPGLQALPGRFGFTAIPGTACRGSSW
jgi:hypothetical protein